MKLDKFLIYIFGILILINLGYSALTDGNIAYWSMDDLTDSSGNGNTLSNSGGTTSTTSCKVGTCYNFDGSNDYLYTSGTILNGVTGATLSIWYKSDVAISSAIKTLITNFDTSASTSNIDLLLVSSSPYTYYKFTPNGGNGNFGGYNANTWYYIVMTWDGSDGYVKVYINNVYKGAVYSGNFENPLHSVTSTLTIGGQIGFSRYFDGIIDEVGIWNRSLSTAEISQLYNNGTGYNPYTSTTPPILTDIQDYYNSENISIQLNTTSNVNMSYILNNGGETSICNNCNNSILNLTSLSEGLYNITFISTDTNGQTNTSDNFTIDLTNPSLNVINNYENNNYVFNWSKIINYSDINIDTCIVSIDNGDNITCNNSSYSFSQNGNHTFNVTATDLAGNTNSSYNNTIFINPYFYVYFNNNSINLKNFSVNGTNYSDYFYGKIYDYGIGNHTFLFQKAGYEEKNFTLNFNLTSNINKTIYLSEVYININLFDVDSGNPAPNNNYTILISETDTGESSSHSIINDNTYSYQNPYSSDTNLTINVISNGTITNTLQLITARKNVTINIYISFVTLSQRVIEVLDSTLIAIPNTDVYLYTYIEGTGFVLETIKKTNTLGQVVFNIVELTKIYNICNTYNGNEKCLQQVTFENSATDPYQIVHDADLTAIEKNYLNYISWSYSENKTNTTSEMTFTFIDSQSLVSSFCYNVTRYTNNTSSYIGEYCNNNPSGQIVQTFSLTTDQYLIYNFYYYYNNEKHSLLSFTSYAENLDIKEANKTSLYDSLFLLIYFGMIGLLLKFNNFTIYNIGILSLLAVFLSIQAIFNESYVLSSIWFFMLLKTITLYFVRVEQ